MNNTFDFSIALSHLKKDQKVSRMKWDGRRFIEINNDWLNPNMEPFIFSCHYGYNEKILWVPTSRDILAEDWYLYTIDNIEYSILGEK